MAASPWTLRRRWWQSAGSVQVLVGLLIQWRRMAWSPSVIWSHRSVPLRIPHSRGRSRGPLRSGLVRCCGGGGLHPGDGMCEELLGGEFLCGWWGRHLGHLIVWLLWGLRFL